jgi:hypothetical protein
MSRKVFVSYSHHDQGEWVWRRLVPCLRTGGANVLIDREQFEAGVHVRGQMDAIQEEAELHLLVLSPSYLRSDYCLHEMRQAIARDPEFKRGDTVIVLRQECPLPPDVANRDPLIVDLRVESAAAQWELLLDRCNANLGVSVPDWLKAGDDVQRHIDRNESVNLTTARRVRWTGIVTELACLPVVNLQHPLTRKTNGLVNAILESLGGPYSGRVDLDDLHRLFEHRPLTRLALTHFDVSRSRHYSWDLFNTLRYHVVDSRKLVVLIQSKRSFCELLPSSNPLSDLDLKTVELGGLPE